MRLLDEIGLEGKQPQIATIGSQRWRFKCQGLGHIALECTNRQIVTLVDEECADELENDNEEVQATGNEEKE